MLLTAEVRWFFEGMIPADVLARFQSPGLTIGISHDPHLVREEDPRTDAYILQPDVNHVGIKFRQGLLEVKSRRGKAVSRTVAVGGAGRFDNWSKISVPSNALLATDMRPEDRDLLLSVTKRRWLRRYLVEGDRLVSGSLDEIPATACNVELVGIGLRPGRTTDECEDSAFAQPAFSISFEAYGERALIGEARDRVMEAVLPLLDPQGLGLSLTEENSLSYPHWLNLQYELIHGTRMSPD